MQVLTEARRGRCRAPGTGLIGAWNQRIGVMGSELKSSANILNPEPSLQLPLHSFLDGKSFIRTRHAEILGWVSWQ